MRGFRHTLFAILLCAAPLQAQNAGGLPDALTDDAIAQLEEFITRTSQAGSYGNQVWFVGVPEADFVELALSVYRERQHEVMYQVLNNIAALIGELTTSDADRGTLRFTIYNTESTELYAAAYRTALAAYSSENSAPVSAADLERQQLLSETVRLLEEQRELWIERYRLAALAGLPEEVFESLANIERTNRELDKVTLDLEQINTEIGETTSGSEQFLSAFHRDLADSAPFSDMCPALVSDAFALATSYSSGFGQQELPEEQIGSCIPLTVDVYAPWTVDTGDPGALRFSLVYQLRDETWQLVNIRANFASNQSLIYLFEEQGEVSGLRLNRYLKGVEYP